MVWIYGGKGATHKMWLGSSQRFLRNLSLQTDDGRTGGRTTDACALTVALLTKSSRAKNVNANLLEIFDIWTCYKQ